MIVEFTEKEVLALYAKRIYEQSRFWIWHVILWVIIVALIVPVVLGFMETIFVGLTNVGIGAWLLGAFLLRARCKSQAKEQLNYEKHC